MEKDWVEGMVGLVGQQFGDEQDTQINGAVVSIRNRGGQGSSVSKGGGGQGGRWGNRVSKMLGGLGFSRRIRNRSGSLKAIECVNDFV